MKFNRDKLGNRNHIYNGSMIEPGKIIDYKLNICHEFNKNVKNKMHFRQT